MQTTMNTVWNCCWWELCCAELVYFIMHKKWCENRSEFKSKLKEEWEEKNALIIITINNNNNNRKRTIRFGYNIESMFVHWKVSKSLDLYSSFVSFLCRLVCFSLNERLVVDGEKKEIRFTNYDGISGDKRNAGTFFTFLRSNIQYYLDSSW